MTYDLRGGGLRGGAGRGLSAGSGSGVDPMANVANIVDAMLVLSLGLMVAIVMYWNVDLKDVQEMVRQDEVTEVADVDKMAEDMSSAGSSYNELGTVYQDPKTGKMYMLTQDVDKGASNAGKAGE